MCETQEAKLRFREGRVAVICRCRGQEGDFEMVRIRLWLRENMRVWDRHTCIQQKTSARPDLFLISTHSWSPICSIYSEFLSYGVMIRWWIGHLGPLPSKCLCYSWGRQWTNRQRFSVWEEQVIGGSGPSCDRGRAAFLTMQSGTTFWWREPTTEA